MAAFEKWLKIALLNLCIVALLGVTLRYKIAFSLPFIDQKHLMHGHSHFAFSGWITMALMTLLIYYLFTRGQANLFRRYRLVLTANLVTAFGMMISLSLNGYTGYAIVFSTLSIFVSYLFAILYWKDLSRLKDDKTSHLWFRAALIFSVISSAGPFYLAYLMSSHTAEPRQYLASVYHFLHFQYNGWFIFSCMGLFIAKLSAFQQADPKLRYIFWIFAFACIPSFFLSVPWLKLPEPVNFLDVLSAFFQLCAWIWFILLLRKSGSFPWSAVSRFAKFLFLLAAISFSIKLILQLSSSYHPLSQLVFGFRPIVIGYLHLVFLGIVTVFIFGYILSENLITITKGIRAGIIILISGIFINEILLMLQGILALAGISVHNMNLYLLIAALIMFCGILCINISGKASVRKTP